MTRQQFIARMSALLPEWEFQPLHQRSLVLIRDPEDSQMLFDVRKRRHGNSQGCGGMIRVWGEASAMWQGRGWPQRLAAKLEEARQDGLVMRPLEPILNTAWSSGGLSCGWYRTLRRQYSRMLSHAFLRVSVRVDDDNTHAGRLFFEAGIVEEDPAAPYPGRWVPMLNKAREVESLDGWTMAVQQAREDLVGLRRDMKRELA